ncbi:MAG: hypothetical protein WDW38_009210 [Sanguina aurantia]
MYDSQTLQQAPFAQPATSPPYAHPASSGFAPSCAANQPPSRTLVTEAEGKVTVPPRPATSTDSPAAECPPQHWRWRCSIAGSHSSGPSSPPATATAAPRHPVPCDAPATATAASRHPVPCQEGGQLQPPTQHSRGRVQLLLAPCRLQTSTDGRTRAAQRRSGGEVKCAAAAAAAAQVWRRSPLIAVQDSRGEAATQAGQEPPQPPRPAVRCGLLGCKRPRDEKKGPGQGRSPPPPPQPSSSSLSPSICGAAARGWQRHTACVSVAQRGLRSPADPTRTRHRPAPACPALRLTPAPASVHRGGRPCAPLGAQPAVLVRPCLTVGDPLSGLPQGSHAAAAVPCDRGGGVCVEQILGPKEQAVQLFQSREFDSPAFVDLHLAGLDEAGVLLLQSELSALKAHCKTEVEGVVEDHHLDFLEASRQIPELDSMIRDLRQQLMRSSTRNIHSIILASVSLVFCGCDTQATVSAVADLKEGQKLLAGGSSAAGKATNNTDPPSVPINDQDPAGRARPRNGSSPSLPGANTNGSGSGSGSGSRLADGGSGAGQRLAPLEAALQGVVQDLDVAAAERDFESMLQLLQLGGDAVALVDRDAAVLAAEVPDLSGWREGFEGVMQGRRQGVLLQLQARLEAVASSSSGGEPGEIREATRSHKPPLCR